MGRSDIDIADMVGAYPVCSNCQSKQVVRDAWAEWSQLTNEWVLKSTFDAWACDACGADITLTWTLDKAFRKKRIQRLNDALRRGEAAHASIVVTQGVQALGEDALAEISLAVATFDSFSEDNDPHGEHDFGALTCQGEKLFWKIDYFDLALKLHSPDAANPEVTHRVLTIMLACEY